MPTSQTTLRRQVRADWLRRNPTVHEWLRLRLKAPLDEMRREPMALDMVSALKAEGIYSATTVGIDICAAMRRMAARYDPSQITPTERALAEIATILTRPGVIREEVMEGLLQ